MTRSPRDRGPRCSFTRSPIQVAREKNESVSSFRVKSNLEKLQSKYYGVPGVTMTQKFQSKISKINRLIDLETQILLAKTFREKYCFR